MLTLADFEPLISTLFTVQTPAGAKQISLHQATARRQSKSLPAIFGRAELLSLFFYGPAADPLPQGEYDLSHPALETLRLLVVPVGPVQDDRQEYQAVY